IWTFSPKHLHFSSEAKIVKIATFLAIIIFNKGFLLILKVMSVMRIVIGHQTEMYAYSQSEARSSAQLTSPKRKEQVTGKREEFYRIFMRNRKVFSMTLD
ncbi:hypothetical protein ALC56_05282, partial [Trachymyrmex septentrionalis]